MILIGDIGNTDTKICLVNNNYKIVKRIVLSTHTINKIKLNKNLNFIKKKKYRYSKIIILKCSTKKIYFNKIICSEKI